MIPVSASRNTATLLNAASRPTSCVSLAPSPYAPATRPASAVNATMSAITGVASNPIIVIARTIAPPIRTEKVKNPIHQLRPILPFPSSEIFAVAVGAIVENTTAIAVTRRMIQSPIPPKKSAKLQGMEWSSLSQSASLFIVIRSFGATEDGIALFS